jgi:hypothetical protein
MQMSASQNRRRVEITLESAKFISIRSIVPPKLRNPSLFDLSCCWIHDLLPFGMKGQPLHIAAKKRVLSPCHRTNTGYGEADVLGDCQLSGSYISASRCQLHWRIRQVKCGLSIFSHAFKGNQTFYGLALGSSRQRNSGNNYINKRGTRT